MCADNTYVDAYEVNMKSGGGGTTGARSARQRGGAKAPGAAAGRGFISTDNRRRTNAVKSARASLGLRTQRARVR